MTTANQGMSVEEIEQIIAQRVANVIETIAIYETKTRMAQESISQTKQQEKKLAGNASNKRKREGHYRRDCPELKNRNHGNQAGDTEARGLMYALGGGEIDQDPNNMEVDINAKDHAMLRICHLEKVPSNLESEESLTLGTLDHLKSLIGLARVAYKLELSEELGNVHNTFHVSNLKKCLSDESLVIPMKELQLDEKLNFVKEPIEITDQEVKQLKQSRIPIVKVRWNSKRGPEFT
ncbi:hypothetical protein Tco_0290594 [Tanacetum coccineum]